jgi:hypothetical protein
MKTSKFQTQSSKKHPITNPEAPIPIAPFARTASFWGLRLCASLVLGCWGLGLFCISPACAQYSINWSTIGGGGGGTSTGACIL